MTNDERIEIDREMFYTDKRIKHHIELNQVRENQIKKLQQEIKESNIIIDNLNNHQTSLFNLLTKDHNLNH